MDVLGSIPTMRRLTYTKNWRRHATLAWLCIALCTSCASSRVVRPLRRNQFAAGASLGGPIFSNLAIPVLTPATQVYGRYGLTGHTDIDLGVHLPVSRVGGVDLGVAHLFVKNKRHIPALLAGARLSFFGNVRSWTQPNDGPLNPPLHLDLRIFEELYAHASWDITPTLIGYAGVDLFAQAEAKIFHPSLLFGMLWHTTLPVSIQADFKWLAVEQNTHLLSMRYLSVAHQGAIALHLSVTYYFGRPPFSTPPMRL